MACAPSHRSNRTRPTTLVLSSAILILFCSTTVYTVSNFFSIQGALLASIASVGLEAWAVPLEYGGMDSPFDANVYGPKLGQFPASCAGTGALTINVRVFYLVLGLFSPNVLYQRYC